MEAVWLPTNAVIGPIPRTNLWLYRKLKFQQAKARDSSLQDEQKTLLYANTALARIYDKTSDPEM